MIGYIADANHAALRGSTLRVRFGPLVLAGVGTLLLAACGGQSAALPQATTTVTQTATVTSTVTATVNVKVPVGLPPVTVTQTVAQPEPASPQTQDVTREYVAWEKAHYPPVDGFPQWREIVNASMTGGVVRVLTTMLPGMGGYDCESEPSEMSGEPVKYIQILRTDETIFRSC